MAKTDNSNMKESLDVSKALDFELTDEDLADINGGSTEEFNAEIKKCFEGEKDKAAVKKIENYIDDGNWSEVIKGIKDFSPEAKARINEVLIKRFKSSMGIS